MTIKVIFLYEQIYIVSRKKRSQYFCNITYKTQAMLTKFGEGRSQTRLNSNYFYGDSCGAELHNS